MQVTKEPERSKEAATGWSGELVLRPISDAPKDGTPILLYTTSDVKQNGLQNIAFVGRYVDPIWEWTFAAPVEFYGGIPDECLRGWLPIPKV